jgi:hypothetical protein
VRQNQRARTANPAASPIAPIAAFVLTAPFPLAVAVPVTVAKADDTRLDAEATSEEFTLFPWTASQIFGAMLVTSETLCQAPFSHYTSRHWEKEQGVLLMSAVEHPLPMAIQGPILDISAEELLQRHEKSVGLQLMSLAACARQGRAHVGSWATKLARGVDVEPEPDDVVVGDAVGVTVVDWAEPSARKRESIKALGCMLIGYRGGVGFGASEWRKSRNRR